MDLIFYTDQNKSFVIAARRTGSAIIFNQKEKKWETSSRTYYQLDMAIAYDGLRYMSFEEAKKIFNDVLPDLKRLDLLDSLKNGSS